VSYTPNDLTVYSASYSGAFSGLTVSGRWIEDTAQGDYSGFALISGAFAQEFDTQWAISPDTIPPNTLQVFIIFQACKGLWDSRNSEVTSTTLNPSEYSEVIGALITTIKASDAYVAAQGITPNPWPTGGGGGGVDSVIAGTAISITGSSTNPVVNNIGVTAAVAGTGIGVSGATGNVTISNTGVLALTAGTNVTITGTASNPIINSSNPGGTLTGITAGTGIAVSGSAPSPTVSNTGVLSNIAGTGISVSGATGNVTISNTGVLALTAGTNVTITGTASNPIINSSNPGGTLTGITAGTGIAVSGSAPSPTVSNTGVLSVAAGTNVTITGSASNPTINATGVLTGVTAGTGIAVTGSTPTETVARLDINVTQVTASNTPYTALATDSMILFMNDATNNPSNVQLKVLMGAAPQTGAEITFVWWTTQNAANNPVVVGNGGISVEDINNPGTLVASPNTTYLGTPYQRVSYKYVAGIGWIMKPGSNT